jgi:hypothetical protein
LKIGLKKLIITFIAIVVSTCNLYSQKKTIKGRVISEDFEAVPIVSIIINDTVKVAQTGLDGFFQINIPLYEKKILLQAVGFELTKIELANTCDQVEVIMLFSSTYDFKTLKKIDRLRMKKFKKLPGLHKIAFAKGLFKTDKPCYIQEFIPDYKKKKSNIKTKSLLFGWFFTLPLGFHCPA